MNIKKYLLIFTFVFVTSNIFAQEQKFVLFFESLESIPLSILKKINSSDKLCICANITNTKNISAYSKNLIISNKIEPTLSIDEPYFILVSSNINITTDISFDRSKDTISLISNYKKDFKDVFEKRKLGLFLKNGILDDNTLQILYKQNIYWTTTKLQNSINSTAFIKDNVVIFVPYTDFPKEKEEFDIWLKDNTNEIIPIFISKETSKNEKLILSLLKEIEKNKNYNTYLPINLSYDIAKQNNGKDITFELTDNIPFEILLKIAKASQEIDEQEENKDSQTYEFIYSELSNMYSCKIINGILNNNKFSKKLFDISYENIFRLSNKEVPNINKLLTEDLQKQEIQENNNQVKDFSFEVTELGYKIENDKLIKSFSVYKNSKNILFDIDIDINEVDYISIYIDMNNISYAGNQKLLNNLGFFVPEHCWEYSLEATNKNCKVYRFILDKTNAVAELDINSINHIEVPANIIKGNPYNWNYQVVAIKDNCVVDFLETTSIKKEKVLNSSPLLLKMINISK